MLVNFSAAASDQLQSDISSGLLDELSESREGERDLRINVSNTLIRWFDFRNTEATVKLRRIIKSVSVRDERETHENLVLCGERAKSFRKGVKRPD